MTSKSISLHVAAAALVFLAGCRSSDDPVIGVDPLVLPPEEIPKLELAALDGETDAAIKLSNYYGFVVLDEELQMKWLRVAANNGSTLAQMNFAILLLDKREKSASEVAVQYLRMAADTGDSSAQLALAELYERGEGVDADPNAAKLLYESAANHGEYRAMVRIGEFALDGIGGPVDKILGLSWLLKAQAIVPDDTVLYDELSEKIENAQQTMSQSQIDKAMRTSRQR